MPHTPVGQSAHACEINQVSQKSRYITIPHLIPAIAPKRTCKVPVTVPVQCLVKTPVPANVPVGKSVKPIGKIAKTEYLQSKCRVKSTKTGKPVNKSVGKLPARGTRQSTVRRKLSRSSGRVVRNLASPHQALWLCDVRECSMISTIVKPLSAQRGAKAESRFARQNTSDQGDCFPPVGVSTGIRAAGARSQVYLPHRDFSGTSGCRA